MLVLNGTKLMQKIKNIEFLRVFLMFGIVMLHSYMYRTWNICKLYPEVELFEKLKQSFYYASNGVEGFFIIAGFLLYLTFKNSESINRVIQKKLIRFSPVISFAVILCFILLALR